MTLLCVRSLCFLGRNLKICKPGQQRERKPEADPEAAAAAEGHGMSAPVPWQESGPVNLTRQLAYDPSIFRLQGTHTCQRSLPFFALTWEVFSKSIRLSEK